MLASWRNEIYWKGPIDGSSIASSKTTFWKRWSGHKKRSLPLPKAALCVVVEVYQMNPMSQEREKILLEFYPGWCLPVHFGHSDTLPSKVRRIQVRESSFWALRNSDKIHTGLVSSAGDSRTRVGPSARLRSIRVVLWHPPPSSLGGWVSCSPSGISSQILDDATRWPS